MHNVNEGMGERRSSSREWGGAGGCFRSREILDVIYTVEIGRSSRQLGSADDHLGNGDVRRKSLRE